MAHRSRARHGVPVLVAAGVMLGAACGGRAESRGWGPCAQWNDDPRACYANGCHPMFPSRFLSDPELLKACVGEKNGVFLTEPGCYPRKDCEGDDECGPNGRCVELTYQPCETLCYTGGWCALARVCQAK